MISLIFIINLNLNNQMEINRLKPMKDGYSEELFNQIYQETKGLRKKLSHSIDTRYYGVSRDIIESWFDDKFIMVFNKHFDNKDPDLLKGYIITSLLRFKNRVLRKAYDGQGEFYSSRIELDSEDSFINFIPDESTQNPQDIFLELCLEFMKNKLTDDGLLLLQTQLNPPPFLLDRMKQSNSKITVKLLLEFFSLDDTNRNRKYISRLKKEIAITTEKAKEYFSQNTPLALTN